MTANTDYITEMLSEQFAGKTVKPNSNNKMTKARRSRANKLIRDSEGNPDIAFNMAVQDVADNLPAIQRFVLSKGETPLSDPIDIARQAYQLRVDDITKIADAMGVPFGEAQLFIEDAESNSADINAPESDSFLGGLFSSIGAVAGNALQQAAIKRAGTNKNPGILGALTPGYSNLQAYLKAHPDQKGKVTLDEQGNIVSTDAYVNQNAGGVLAGGIAKDIFATDAANAISDQARKAVLKRNMPYIIGGAVLLVIVIIFIARANRH